MRSNKISHVTAGKTGKKLEINDIMSNFHFPVEKEMPEAIVPLTAMISTFLESSLTSNSMSIILTSLLSTGHGFWTGMSEADKSGGTISD